MNITQIQGAFRPEQMIKRTDDDMHREFCYIAAGQITQKLLDKVDNLTGMDGDKLFEIAKKCRYGLTEQDGRWRIDDALLLAE